MKDMAIANGGTLWFLCALVIVAVIIQTIVFMKKGWAEAIALGVPKEQLKKTVTASISVSILPSIPIILILFAMLPIMGVPIPWLRLTVIGSAGYEMLAASMGVAATGQKFAAGSFSKEAFGAAIWVMSIGGSVATLVTLCILRPITLAYDKFKASNIKLITIIGLCCLTGVLGSVTADYGTRSVMGGIVISISAISAFVLITIAKKFPKLKWLNDFYLALSMIIAMAGAIIIS
ncbi:MAG: DUF5058 family protein [Sedimentibacter sp.]|uniref:DUF5058 family protein n=1 Tax=Sedimentibacter sp. TaxID=1960295 RepID=UPI00315829AF